MREIEIDHNFSINAKLLVDTNIKNFPCCDITWHKVPVCWIFFFEEIPRFSIFIRPDSTTFTPSRFTHQTQFIVARNSGWMDLDEFTDGIFSPLLVQNTSRRTCINHRVSRLAENNSRTACCHNSCISWESLNFMRRKVLGNDPSANAIIIENSTDKFPVFIFGNEAFNFKTAHLFIQSI